MGEFSPIQQQRINEYREQHGDYVSNDDAIVNAILRDMEKAGVVYEGFESLMKTKKQAPTQNPTPLAPENNNPNYNLLFDYYKKPQTFLPEKQRDLTEFERKSLDFLKKMIDNSKNALNMQDLREGYISIANFWGGIKNTFNTQFSRDAIDSAINDTESDINRLQLAAEGRLFDKNGKQITFEQVFLKERGVEFSLVNVIHCEKSAEKKANDFFHIFYPFLSPCFLSTGLILS